MSQAWTRTQLEPLCEGVRLKGVMVMDYENLVIVAKSPSYVAPPNAKRTLARRSELSNSTRFITATPSAHDARRFQANLESSRCRP